MRNAFHVLVVGLAVSCSSPRHPEQGPTGSGRAPGGKTQASIEHRAANPAPTAAYRWIDIMLEATGREVDRVGARPTIISRQMAIAVTAMYDAWAAYDERAVGTRFKGALRRPAAERTQANKEKAIAHAMYRALVDLFPGDRDWLADQMRREGHDPNDDSTDRTTPVGIGNLVAEALIAYRSVDGANQAGATAGSTGEPYSDYTGYAPVNPVDGPVVDADRWQPIPFTMPDGSRKVLGYLTPHWQLVKPFALERADQFRPGPPPRVGSPELAREVAEVMAFNAGLTAEQKAIVEFMRDGPRSTGQSGHWLQFAQDVSRRDRYDLDKDVKLFFAVANTAFDAFIAAWDAKRAYDSSRPWTLVRVLHKDREIDGYLGACKGSARIPSDQWHPYSPPQFVTPPFPGYVSGHSTVSGACAKMLELFTGSDRYGAWYRHRPGMYTEEACTQPEVVLRMPTFSATAEMAGISRVMGGYHIQSDNTAGLELGRSVATHSWPKYQAYFSGTAR
ncbi:MAG TPA: vanadium-dependent haloperoxidase [Kofleriaceae bacterium]|nr:vanadium-dependent haloperoxidase [Kofleriaceae bacterium]